MSDNIQEHSVATLKDGDGIMRLQDDLNPYASDTDPRCISLTPLVALPHCQTKIVTDVSMSTSSPEDEDCVVAVAVKFLGPAAQSNEWTNVRIENPCFYSSRVMFSRKDEMFRIPGSGGHLIGSWDLSNNRKLQSLRFQNLPKLPTATRELMNSCSTTDHLVESRSTSETFLVKHYWKTAEIIEGVAIMETKFVTVFKLDEEGNAVFTQNIGDLSIFLSRSEPFSVPASSFPGLIPNFVYVRDFDEIAFVDLKFGYIANATNCTFPAPYYIPPQNID